MPGTYPPAAPSLAGDLLTIHRLLQTPALIQRRLRSLSDLGFIADLLLTGRYRSSGGAVLYEQSEPVMNTRLPRAVAPGAEYPMDTPGVGTAALAAVSKWGQKVPVTDEQIKRAVNGGQVVDRSLRKTVNTIISKVDKLAISAVASAVTATVAATATWSGTSARMLRDIELGVAYLDELQDGYVADAVLCSHTRYAELISDETVAAMLRREDGRAPIYTGKLEKIGNLTLLHTSAANLPTDDVWVVDTQQLGGMADEAELDPGYATSDNGVQIKSIRKDDIDAFHLQGRRITVPVVENPAAAVRITGTAGS